MKKEYKVNLKYDVGDEVWVVDSASFDKEMPKIFVGKVSRVEAILSDIDKLTEPVVSYSLTLAGAYHLQSKTYYEWQLNTEKEAKKIFKTYSDRVNPFKDQYIRDMKTKAKKFLEVYDK